MIPNVEVTLIWYDSTVPYQTDLTALNTYLVQSDFMNNFIEYATPTQVIGRGKVVGSYTETNIQTSLTDTDVKKYIRSLVQKGAITPNQNSYYTIYMKDGINVTAGVNGASCNDFAGYHGTAYIGDIYENTNQTYYGVIPLCGSNMDSLAGTTSHELAEAITDSWNGWRVPTVTGKLHSGDEIGDICSWQLGTVDDPASGKQWQLEKLKLSRQYLHQHQ
ncbi:hypothetical protein BCR33DRAFT_475560 [Rhizoclosmatium globosum]|uniref:Uncharacterized protein n=1 Tax=Rhizoclosmatium globosum TaxID=329046 RepID=A0A1Y2BPP8_9FUNG|nr:hypothetical protein BCR33DRAFT_475560 [Rhizoclosmatium globosum]|eukprot:ORY36710.1 hypothetical protein BCR33DRAFT_475560 [Rhizoclosmatium globosum]